jgi:hypothetical protein
MRKRLHRTPLDPMAWINRRTPLAPDQTRDIGIATHAALQALLSDHGTEQAWATLACSINTALILAELGVRPEIEPIVKLAQQALMQIRRAALSNGEWRVNVAHHHKHALLAAINAHDEQCASATRAQITNALREVHRRVENDEVLA